MWATWCKTCVEAVLKLHRIHDESEGLVLISLSVDESPDAVETFRERRYPMPWTYVWTPREQVVPGWGVPTIPVYVLVGSDGVILAVASRLGDVALIDGLKPFKSGLVRVGDDRGAAET